MCVAILLESNGRGSGLCLTREFHNLVFPNLGSVTLMNAMCRSPQRHRNSPLFRFQIEGKSLVRESTAGGCVLQSTGEELPLIAPVDRIWTETVT